MVELRGRPPNRAETVPTVQSPALYENSLLCHSELTQTAGGALLDLWPKKPEELFLLLSLVRESE